MERKLEREEREGEAGQEYVGTQRKRIWRQRIGDSVFLILLGGKTIPVLPNSCC